MQARLFFSAACSLGLLGVACSSSSGGSSNPYPHQEDFCTAVAKAECQSGGNDAFDNCGVTGGSATQCISFRTDECMKGSIIVPFPGSDQIANRTYTSENVQPCLDALNAAFGSKGSSAGVSSISYSTLFGAGGLEDICEKVFVGNRADMQSCATSYDCTQAGEVCAQDPLNPSSSVCATPRQVALGDACRDPGDDCTNGFCTGSPPVCVALVADGAACTQSAQCLSTSRCVSGKCAALGVANDPCSSNADCAAASQLFCDTYRSTGAVCAKGLILGGSAPDCSGFLFGTGVGSVDASTGGDSSTTGDSAAPVGDAASGG